MASPSQPAYLVKLFTTRRRVREPLHSSGGHGRIDYEESIRFEAKLFDPFQITGVKKRVGRKFRYDSGNPLPVFLKNLIELAKVVEVFEGNDRLLVPVRRFIASMVSR